MIIEFYFLHADSIKKRPNEKLTIGKVDGGRKAKYLHG